MKFFNRIIETFETKSRKKSSTTPENSTTPPQKEQQYSHKDYYFNFNSGMSSNLSDNSGYFSFATNGYIRNPVAFRAVNIIAHTSSAINLFLIQHKDGSIYNLNDHELKNLINKPNPFSTRADFIEKIIYYLLIGGNAFILRVKNASNKIKELYILDSRDIEILTDKTNSFPLCYRHSNGAMTKDYVINQINGDCDVLHLKNFHPTNNIYGLSPFEAAAEVIDQHNLTTQWNKNLMKNSARPSGALVINPTKNERGFLTPEQRNDLRRELDEVFSNAKNSGRPMILEGGLEWKEMSMKPKDLDFFNVDKVVVRQIANVFGVPIQLLNDADSSSYNNYLESKRALYENTVLPLLNKIISSIFNNWLCPHFDKNLEVIYKEEDIPALSYKKEQQIKNLHESNFLTINEKRRELGLDPIDGGDKL